MESLFIKVVCIGFFITCITVRALIKHLNKFVLKVFYEEVVDFVKIQTYGNPYWLNVSQQVDCSCDNGKTRNCYPHPDDSKLCGKCFATCPQMGSDMPEEHDKNTQVFE